MVLDLPRLSLLERRCGRRWLHKRPGGLISITRSTRMNALSTFWTLAVTLISNLVSYRVHDLVRGRHTPNFLDLHV
jgi:hypothetical protein